MSRRVTNKQRHVAQVKEVAEAAVRPWLKDNFILKKASLAQYVNEVSGTVAEIRSGLEADGHCACLVLSPLDALGSLKASALAQTKNVLSQLGGAKLVTLPNFPVGQQKTVRKQEEIALDEMNPGMDEPGEEGEDAFDALLDPMAVEAEELPAVSADGGTKLTKVQRLVRSSKDREQVRKAMESVGGSSNKHFMLSCPLQWEGRTRMNSHMTECVVLAPETAGSHHDWVQTSALVEGGLAGLSAATDFVRISKLAAEAVQLKGSTEAEFTTDHRSKAYRLQKDIERPYQPDLKVVFDKIFRKLDKNAKSVLFVNLFGMSQDWGAAFLEWSLGASVKAKCVSYDFKEEYHVVGLARVTQRAMELFNEGRLPIPSKEPLTTYKPSAPKSHSKAVAKMNSEMKHLKVQGDGTLSVPSVEALAAAFQSTPESLRLLGVDAILKESREMKARLQPLADNLQQEKATGPAQKQLMESYKIRSAFKMIGVCELANGIKVQGMVESSTSVRRLGVTHAQGNQDLVIPKDTVLGCCGAMKLAVADDYEEEVAKPCFEFNLGSGQQFVDKESMSVCAVPEFLSAKGVNFKDADKALLVYGHKAMLNLTGGLLCFPSTRCVLHADVEFEVS